jgi:hypothetical protein
MLRRVTALTMLGASQSAVASRAPAEFGLLRRGQGRSFTEFDRRRPGRSSASPGLVVAVWNLDPPETLQRKLNRLVPFSF